MLGRQHGSSARFVVIFLAGAVVLTAPVPGVPASPAYGSRVTQPAALTAEADGRQKPPASERQTLIKIGVLAERGTERCLEKWGPTAEYLTGRIPGRSFVIVPLGFREVCPTVNRGEVDFVLANPTLYVEMETRHGASRIATLKNRLLDKVHTVLGGVIFRRANRKDIQHLGDLKGKRFMAVEESSFGGWRAAWREFKEHGIDPHRDFRDLSFGGTHDAVVYAVRDGEVDAGTIRTDTLERMAMEGKIRLGDFKAFPHDHAGKHPCYFPFLHSTDTYPEWPFAKTRQTSDELAEQVAAALMNMPADCPAAKAAKCAGWTVPLNYQPVHDCLKELRVGPYKDFGKITLGDVPERYRPWIVSAVVLLSGMAATLALALRLLRQRKRAEETLRASEERHRTITESAKDAIITADAEGNIRFWNSAAETIFGYSEAEVVGKNLLTCIVPPQYHEAKRKGLAVFTRTGQGAAIGKTLELTALRKDGSEFPIEISISGYKERDNFVAVAGIRDITERKRAEEELKRAHAETSHLLESIPSILISLDENDKITAWNVAAEHAFGIAAQDANGRSLDDCGVRGDIGVVQRNVSACRGTNKPMCRGEARFKRPDGGEGFLGFAVNPIKPNGSKEPGVLIVASDITEHKILEGQLLQSQRLESIGQLAAGIAHEINTPTQFVSDNTRFLQKAFPKLQGLLAKYVQFMEASRSGSVSPECLADLETAVKEAKLDYLLEQIPEAITDSLEGLERVASIVRAMKDFSHPGAEGKSAADLNKAIESTITVARNEWKYVADMVMDFDPSLPPVPCVLGDFNQVILNIVVNAAHAIAGVVGDGGQGKGTITITTRHDDNEAEIRISDTGTGIPEEHRSKVFDHFFTTKEVGKGTGQGLSIAHSVITEKHGGTLTFETEIGKGTTFIIRLPIEPESAAAEETPQHEEAYSVRG